MTKKEITEDKFFEDEEELKKVDEQKEIVEKGDSKKNKEEQEEIPEVLDDKENKFKDKNKFVEEFSFNQFSKTKPLSLENVVEKNEVSKNLNQRENFSEEFSSQSETEQSQQREQQKNLYQDYSPNIYESEKRQIQNNINLIARAEKIEPASFSIASPTTTRRDSNLIINPELQELQRQSQQKTDRDYVAKAEKIDRDKRKLPFEQDLTEDYKFQ
ncbi:hypothetical protein K9L16_00935 [Candidatus Pacearchaeota archaeon]|nr:hypothetical protein [Candidatus Pacearchaeota archaeon]